MEPLIVKYRPKQFSDVIGQDAVVRSLQVAIKKGTKTFLFTGPSGVGKTTVARLVAQELGCSLIDRLEIDAATYTGIDDIRNVTAGLQYRPLGANSVKALIVDEAHALSKQAWNALLKMLEEPPEWVVWCLCTTEGGRVPETIKTRCAHYVLKPVEAEALAELLDKVVEAEDFRTNSKIVDLCAIEANGSPRQALANLSVCAEAASLTEAQELLRSALDSEEAVTLARALVKGAGWVEIQRILSGLAEVNPETVRHVVRAYVSKVALGAKSESVAGQALELLDCFSEPYNSSDGISPLLLSCGKAVLR